MIWRSRIFFALLTFSFLTAMSTVVRADLVITMGGDVNFNRSRQLPNPDGADRDGVRPFSSYSKGIKPLLDGDLNFANIETVVTERTDLRLVPKTFNFQSHPNAIRHLLDLGFNLFSLANNHAQDYGTEGIQETLRTFQELGQERAIAYAGIGTTLEAAATPVVFEVNGHTIAFAAIGISAAYAAGVNTPGVLAYSNETHYRLVLKKMRESRADLKILSIHSGTEMQTSLDEGQRERFRRAIREGGVDLVIGHHPHVVRPLEMIDGKLIIYSLGNYLMLGAASLDGNTLGKDYGLFTRAYFGVSPKTGRLKIQALEAIPLRTMHVQPRPMDPENAARHIDYLNELSRTELGDSAVRFNLRHNGTGVACDGSATEFTERAAAACADYVTPRLR